MVFVFLKNQNDVCLLLPNHKNYRTQNVFFFLLTSRKLKVYCLTVKLYFFFFFLGYGPFLKSLLNLLHYCFCFIILAFLATGMWDLSSRSGIKPARPALEGEVLTTGPPGRSLTQILWKTTENVQNFKRWYTNLRCSVKDLSIQSETRWAMNTRKSKVLKTAVILNWELMVGLQ